MRTAIFAFFLAMIAMLCTAASAESGLEIRAAEAKTVCPTAAFDATVSLLVSEQASIVAKAYADVCTDADLSSAVQTDLSVQITGLVNFDFGLGAKLSAALQSSIKASVKAEVDAEIKAQFTANLKANIAAIITKRCPKKDAASIKLQAKNIVSDAIKLTTKASVQISAEIKAKLAAKIKACIDLEVKKFSVNLLLVKINVTGDVKVSESIGLKFQAAAGLCAKACADISAKEVSKIKAICSA
ncbi:hypothetical protein EMPS_09963 [Entomortierella parvispora]|uniref:Uncharacterized protein n=1 Tax=Entomortierella parvispora TaxID=205924 RepID=A0A9P3M0S0_9FUNG|nr:hypothetical protein EMPS_09963 [Entomortierella parvispora]